MDRVGLFQLTPIVLVSAALREVIGVLPVQLGELLQGVVAMMKPVAWDFLEQPPANDLVALFLTCRAPRRLYATERLLEACQRLLAAFTANLDLRCRQGSNEQRARARLNRLG
jgi:hypothetical protein